MDSLLPLTSRSMILRVSLGVSLLDVRAHLRGLDEEEFVKVVKSVLFGVFEGRNFEETAELGNQEHGRAWSELPSLPNFSSRENVDSFRNTLRRTWSNTPKRCFSRENLFFLLTPNFLSTCRWKLEFFFTSPSTFLSRLRMFVERVLISGMPEVALLWSDLLLSLLFSWVN